MFDDDAVPISVFGFMVLMVLSDCIDGEGDVLAIGEERGKLSDIVGGDDGGDAEIKSLSMYRSKH
ncbi:hypothetical protein CROQUDRAFT_650057 [Cronartium quercuum f. sp. fusiforme G11]|uniref:Uncharacterized protein n=1 Tax=Cronartium quercuum f. sp. fusiforme G11 TaxID=708437 RepID=A0A9P6NVB5_9BASI|nr:hypothetical protein CROQUDRAFT_650057 [Cronartium quercuum f. sp. fusiforme G11]